MRTLAAVERELTYNRTIAAAEKLGDTLDNDGNVAQTAEYRRAIARRAVARLEAERVSFLRILGRSS